MKQSNVVYLDRHVRLQMLALHIRRDALERQFNQIRDSLYEMRRELGELDADIRYYRKQLEQISRMNNEQP